MERYKYVIVGGGAAGTAAAEAIRGADKESAVAVVNDEPYALYSRVMLSKPNFFLGKIPFDQIYIKGHDWYEKNNITFLGGKKAVDLDPKNKILALSDGSKISYEKLLIATGVDARKWNVKGADKKGIHYLRTLDDGKGIMSALKGSKHAVTIGGGFISFEMADLLKLAGLETTMVLRESYFWEPILDEASGMMIENALTKAGIKIIKKAEVAEVLGGENVEAVVLNDGSKISCEMIMCGIGVVNPIDWLKKDGVSTNRGILTNEFLETNLPDVYAAGDIAEYKDLLLEENVQMGNWVNAREQGRIAGLNMMGGDKKSFKFVSFYTTQGVGITIAFVGDVNPGTDRIIVKRGSPEINSYGRIIIDSKGELVGATLINRTSELTTLAKLIEGNINVSEKFKELGDVSFDLKKLLG
ncbi:MAG: FAD-dependent oxidoreductase [Candidatus Paceibacterota bacterium]|jgi:NAD(P)H-nitrite reductase large subunit